MRGVGSAGRSRSLSFSPSLSIECRDGNYEGTITVDFREYIFDGTIKWLMNYGGSAEKCGRERIGVTWHAWYTIAVKFITHPSETDYRVCTYHRRNFAVRYRARSTLLMGSENGESRSSLKFIEALNTRFSQLQSLYTGDNAMHGTLFVCRIHLLSFLSCNILYNMN